MKHEKQRLDTLLVEKGIVDSRGKAQGLILSGKVSVDGECVYKVGKEVNVSSDIFVKAPPPFVGRGGIKLDSAFEAFKIDPEDKVILDAGASTGGFTDCILKRGARKVIAVDVGYGQFHWSLRNDPRVVLIERKNIRTLERKELEFPVDAIVADLSFISLKLVLEKFRDLVAPDGWMIVLVKPQFEVGKQHVGKGGVVRDVRMIREAVDGIRDFAVEIGLRIGGEIESPIQGPKGNREFLLYLLK
jgi:23S rRNA (cytidine1920-2'-O)/16S rRNA (cytidine1409-2'-O)-methyltransferase